MSLQEVRCVVCGELLGELSPTEFCSDECHEKYTNSEDDEFDVFYPDVDY